MGPQDVLFFAVVALIGYFLIVVNQPIVFCLFIDTAECVA